jgi:hypothetical protein
MNEEVKELRLTVARLEGAAKRLLDVLGHPADGCNGAGATLEALRAAADAEAAVRPRPETTDCRRETGDRKSEWAF